MAPDRGAPGELWPSEDHVEMCRDFAVESGARITLTDNLVAAVNGVDFIHTDVWVSMGEPVETWAQRIEEGFESPANLAFDQAENRMHTINAALVAALG